MMIRQIANTLPLNPVNPVLPALAALSFLLLSGPLARAEMTEECHSREEPVPHTYCVTRDSAGNSPDLLYFLHGKGENEHAWRELPGNAPIRDAWREAGAPPPTVVAISFGSIWLLTDKSPDGGPGLLGFLSDTLLPEIEKELGGLRGRRLLMGDSMGGFNATQLLLKRPGMFARVVLACPAITTVSPHSSVGKIFRYMTRTHASFFKVLEMLLLAGYYFPTREDWDEASPLGLAATNLDRTSPALHVSCGSEDEYGFFEGAERFAAIATERGVEEVTWKLLPGGHCTYDGRSIAGFLSR